jgi:hypothetical protein
VKLPLSWRVLPPSHVAVRALLQVVVVAAFVAGTIGLIEGGVVERLFRIGGAWWAAVRGWALPW